jgi:energy-coupling factor transporter ATP-binding protein EcfA2
VAALRGVSFTASAGKVTGFLGPNGSGKTTTLRILLGLVQPSEGTALIGGVPYARLARPRRSVGALLEAAGFTIGVGLGALTRNLAGAIVVALAWIALIEGIASQLLGSGLARWLPFAASEALDRADLFTASRLLPQRGGGLVLLGYAAIFAGAAVITTLNRDVT